MQPRIPTNIPGLATLAFLNSVNRLRTVASAFSLMEQVFTNTTSASSNVLVAAKPSSCNIDATISLSAKFIAQP